MALIRRNTVYSLNDIVNTTFGIKLKCTTAGTTSTDPLILDGTSPITDGTVVWEVQEESGGTGQGLVDYEANKNYNVGDIVIYDDKIYRCITAHTSTATFDSTKWEEISSGGISNWQASTSYSVGDIVIYNGNLYRCVNANNSSVFQYVDWRVLNKCNIDVWRGAADPDTLALLHFDDPNNWGYNEYGDSFTKIGNNETREGKFGNAMGLVDNQGSLVTPEYSFTNGDEVYTIEFWGYFHRVSGTSHIGIIMDNVGEVAIYATSIGSYVLFYNNTDYRTEGVPITNDAWNYFTFIVSATELSSFVNGTYVGTTIRPDSLPIFIRFGASYTTDYRSRVDELKISRGAKYALSDFAPPTEPFNNPNFDGYDVDDLTVYENNIYRCLVANSDIEFTPAKWQRIDNDDVFIGATSSTNGESGLVPQPTTSDISKFLCGDGTWKSAGGSGLNIGRTLLWTGNITSDISESSPETILDEFTNYDYLEFVAGWSDGTTSYEEVIPASIFCRVNNITNYNPLIEWNCCFSNNNNNHQHFTFDCVFLNSTQFYGSIYRYNKENGSVTGVRYTLHKIYGIKLYNPNNYSTTEQEIGTWIDGKKLYQRTFVGTTGNAGYEVTLGTISNLDKVIDISGIVHHQDGYLSCYYSYWKSNTDRENVYVYINTSNEICVGALQSTLANKDVIVTVKYTKT